MINYLKLYLFYISVLIFIKKFLIIKILCILLSKRIQHQVQMIKTQSQLPAKVFQPFNIISKSKKPNQSDFRVHFTLMNVKWKTKDGQKESKLVQHALGVVNLHCNVHIAQISSVIADDVFDVSFGLCNDEEGYHFLKRKQPLILSDGHQQHKYNPVVSRAFQSYINSLQKSQIKINVQAQIPRLQIKEPILSNPELIKRYSTQKMDIKHFQYKYQINQGAILKKQQIKFQQNTKSVENQNKLKQKFKDSKEKQVKKLWAFGIPKQIEIPQIKQSLKKYGLLPGDCIWKNKEHMQYLQIDLTKPITKNSVYYLGLEVQGYPFVTIPSTEQSEIARNLSKYTVQILTRPSSNDQQKFIKCMYEIGGVNMMIRTPIKQRDDYRILVIFNNVSNAQKACRVARQIRECSAERKQYELKIGRVSKFYTFTALAKQLNLQRQIRY